MTPTNEQRELTYQPLDELIEHPRNPKTHDTATVTHSFARFGTLDPIVLDGRTGYILSGHGRAKALTQMRENGHEPPEGIHTDEQGSWLVPVMSGWSSRTDYDAHAAMIALNRTTELGGWDNSSLVQLLEDLSQIDDGLTGVGYSDDDITKLREQLDTLGVPDFQPDEDGQASLDSLEPRHCPQCGYDVANDPDRLASS